MDPRDEAALLPVRLSKTVAPASAPLHHILLVSERPAIAVLPAFVGYLGGAEGKSRSAETQAEGARSGLAPGLPGVLLLFPLQKEPPFPVNASHATYFSRMRNAISRLFHAAGWNRREIALR